ncbi:MAG: RHS repeat-associated core domain-containing protein [Clostridia bacterium]|nr:RHS repeat-associated core domain-containing protein [Clostridia bacterium]
MTYNDKINESIKYTYDRCGNISEIRENGHLKTKYTYDSLNRLIREDNKHCGTTFVFSYDQNGNITERCEYPYTLKHGEELEELECTHYTYDYVGDKLVNYNGETFTYNALGNPITYRGKAVSWLYGKFLTSYNGTTFAYNGAGQRVSKGNIIFTYDSDGRLLKQSNGLKFIYDTTGVAGLNYNGESYLYRKDVQGNIIAIIQWPNMIVARYEYDAWGNHVVTDKNGNPITSGIGVLNPFRYRSYYYDTETELYYLQTRYYDPELGRFISQDSIEYAAPETINGLNLYAYCANNPVMYVDPTGTMPKWLQKIVDWTSTILGFLNPVSKVTGIGAVLVAAIEGRGADIISDWNNGSFNPFNMNAQVALNSKVFSFYKGESVIRVQNSDVGLQIAGTIFAGTSNFKVVELNHEFGHGVQEKFIGGYYLTRVALPSVITYFVNPNDRTYYSMPWERTADWFGGVSRTFTINGMSHSYKKGALGWSFAELLLGWRVLPLYFGIGF